MFPCWCPRLHPHKNVEAQATFYSVAISDSRPDHAVLARSELSERMVLLPGPRGRNTAVQGDHQSSQWQMLSSHCPLFVWYLSHAFRLHLAFVPWVQRHSNMAAFCNPIYLAIDAVISFLSPARGANDSQRRKNIQRSSELVGLASEDCIIKISARHFSH